MDTSTDFYKYNGMNNVIQENKQPQIQYYIKRKKQLRDFCPGCTGSHVWRKTMYDLGPRQQPGADGILTQVALWESPFAIRSP